jgi:hypothetical protein
MKRGSETYGTKIKGLIRVLLGPWPERNMGDETKAGNYWGGGIRPRVHLGDLHMGRRYKAAPPGDEGRVTHGHRAEGVGPSGQPA